MTSGLLPENLKGFHGREVTMLMLTSLFDGLSCVLVSAGVAYVGDGFPNLIICQIH